MTIHVAATYENGVLRPAEPLNLPDRTPVQVTVVSARKDASEPALRTSSKSSVEEFRRIMREETIRVGALPVSFDRDDIYSDHD